MKSMWSPCYQSYILNLICEFLMGNYHYVASREWVNLPINGKREQAISPYKNQHKY